MVQFRSLRLFAPFLLILLGISLAAACGDSQPREVVVSQEVVREVPQTVVVTADETQSVMNEVNAEISTNLNR